MQWAAFLRATMSRVVNECDVYLSSRQNGVDVKSNDRMSEAAARYLIELHPP